jgi:type II secretory pathway pseudopilin PulG
MRCVKSNRSRSGQAGYVLLAVMFTLTLMLIAMAIEAPRIAQQIKREREEELVHRGKDYATAVKRFVHKNGGRYPLSVEQLENTNHIRFLRKKYKDPITGESDWKMVHVGEAQVNIPAPKGLAGTNNPGLSGSGNPGLGGSSNTDTTSTGANNTGGGLTGGGLSGGGQSGQGNQSGSTGSLTTTNIGNGPTVGGGQIIGVASVSKKQSIKEFNEKDHYDEWYFVYDLRLEQSGGGGVTVAAPRIGGSSTGTSGSQTPVSGSQIPGSQVPGSQVPSSQPPSAGTGNDQPQPAANPTPTPPPVPN